MQKNWRNLIKPKKLEVDKSTLTGTYGKFVAEPLERGYGLTLGNSLRRMLLSALHGAAITSVNFEGVLHEFSSVTGVKEDISDIILNLKQVRILMDSDEPKTMKINFSGSKEFKAGDIECDPSITILNPNLHIATLAKDAKLECELVVSSGRGYLTAEMNKTQDQAVGVIPIDAICQPVIRANFDVTHARVGQRTDYDKLILEVWTTGAIDPQTAVAISAKILKDQLSVFVTFEEEPEEVVEVVEDVEAKPWFNENLFKTVDELELSVRSANCLKNADIKYIGEMVKRTDQEMLRTKNFGRKSLNEIKAILSEMALDFGSNLEGFPTRKELDKRHSENKEAV
ncbi:MAG: DNA-directed RNA polymerase subunit alpha [Deltaproteobacteria bacterium]|nr:DNA-directed RNA polymerase subunit alpha [Deltaproteobacteria bacterium]